MYCSSRSRGGVGLGLRRAAARGSGSTPSYVVCTSAAGRTGSGIERGSPRPSRSRIASRASFGQPLPRRVESRSRGASATASSSRSQYSRRVPAHGAMAPSSMDRSGSGTTSSGSTSRRVPRPSHVGHAPYGELNEKFRGASSSKEMPSYVQASFWLKCCDLLVAVRRLHGDARRCPRPARARSRWSRPPAGGCRAWPPGGPPPPRCVLVVPVQPDRLGEVADLAVDPGPGEPLPGQVGQQLLVLALPAPDDRRQDLEPGALRQLHDLVDDLVGGLAADGPAALGAVGLPDPGVEHPQVVVDLGDGPHRGPGVPGRGLLVDGDGRGQALDEVHVRLLHLAQELPGVGRQRLDVAPLALGVDGVEGQRALPGAGQAREHDERVPGEVERDVLQVVLTGTVNHEPVGAHGDCSEARRHRPRGASATAAGRGRRPRGRLTPWPQRAARSTVLGGAARPGHAAGRAPPRRRVPVGPAEDHPSAPRPPPADQERGEGRHRGGRLVRSSHDLVHADEGALADALRPLYIEYLERTTSERRPSDGRSQRGPTRRRVPGGRDGRRT